jgi:hypothetical protein
MAELMTRPDPFEEDDVTKEELDAALAAALAPIKTELTQTKKTAVATLNRLNKFADHEYIRDQADRLAERQEDRRVREAILAAAQTAIDTLRPPPPTT